MIGMLRIPLFLLLGFLNAKAWAQSLPLTEPSPLTKAFALVDAPPLAQAVSLAQAPPVARAPVIGPAKAPLTTALEQRLEQLRTPVAKIDLRMSTVVTSAPPNVALGMRQTAIPLPGIEDEYVVRPLSRYSVCACQQPLYFEELRLERCGKTCGSAQTVVSAGAFMANAILLPYRMASEPHNRVGCGHGDCLSGGDMPCMEPTKPSVCGIASEGLMLAGLLAILL